MKSWNQSSDPYLNTKVGFLKLYTTMKVFGSFNPKPNNVILATLPKAGITWFCALLFTTMNRTRYDYSTHPLLTQNPHDCVPHIEYTVLMNPSNPLISSITSPLINTHMPYKLLPKPISYSNSKIIYVSRDPMDDFVSLLHHENNVRSQALPPLGVNEAFDMFCDGISPYGSYWDHVLEYWNASLEMPNNVCFVRFEDMKKEPIMVLKKLAQCPFSFEEEQNGVVQKIINFCSLKLAINNNTFFRKGQIGDHKYYLAEDMVKRLKDIINIKFAGSGIDVFA
ncbi:Cytosolic sulfotransferase 15 [Bienertia sinuspersici]